MDFRNFSVVANELKEPTTFNFNLNLKFLLKYFLKQLKHSNFLTTKRPFRLAGYPSLVRYALSSLK